MAVTGKTYIIKCKKNHYVPSPKRTPISAPEKADSRAIIEQGSYG